MHTPGFMSQTPTGTLWVSLHEMAPGDLKGHSEVRMLNLESGEEIGRRPTDWRIIGVQHGRIYGFQHTPVYRIIIEPVGSR